MITLDCLFSVYVFVAPSDWKPRVVTRPDFLFNEAPAPFLGTWGSRGRTTKAAIGDHDEAINYEQTVALVGAETAKLLKDTTISLYSRAADYARERGIIIADTKFEFGLDSDGSLILADEVLTPDSSRFWPEASYAVGKNPPSLDKQYVRDWLDSINFNHQPPGPVLPDEVITRTREIYLKAYKDLAGKELD